MGALVGESEGRTRQMMRLAEAMAPCVLWMDELDKAFGSAQQLDGGTQSRVMASLLTWMQEKESPVFIVATANQITHLPPELLRKGRFDEIFFVGLPSDDERREILELHLKRLRDTHFRRFDLDRLVAVSAGYSGAELACAIIDAMHVGFAQNREFCTEDVLVALRSTVPLSRTAQEAIASLSDWARSGRARSASRDLPRRRSSGAPIHPADVSEDALD
jgi:SpoVK/Ycf46/Vps4 family AAA+-type ATPase